MAEISNKTRAALNNLGLPCVENPCRRMLDFIPQSDLARQNAVKVEAEIGLPSETFLMLLAEFRARRDQRIAAKVNGDTIFILGVMIGWIERGSMDFKLGK